MRVVFTWLARPAVSEFARGFDARSTSARDASIDDDSAQAADPDGGRADQPRASAPTTSIRGCSRTASSSSARRSTIRSRTSSIAQMLFLEAEDPDRDILLYINSPGGSITAGPGDLRHDAVHQARRADHLHRAGGVDGGGAARGRREGQALLAAELAHPDPPAAGCRGSAGRRPTSTSTPRRSCACASG